VEKVGDEERERERVFKRRDKGRGRMMVWV